MKYISKVSEEGHPEVCGMVPGVLPRVNGAVFGKFADEDFSARYTRSVEHI